MKYFANHKLKVIALISMLASLSSPGVVFAVATAANCGKTVGGFLGFPTWYEYLSPQVVGGECKIQFTNFVTDTPKILLAVFDIILRAGGLLAVGFIIYGGIQYIISQGEPDKIKGARTTIINAMVGLVITMSAVVIVNLIGKNL